MIPEASWQQQLPAFPDNPLFCFYSSLPLNKREKAPWQLLRNASKKQEKAKEVSPKDPFSSSTALF